MKWLDKLLDLKKKPKRKKIKVYEDEYVALKQQSSFYYTKYKELKEKFLPRPIEPSEEIIERLKRI